MPSCLGIPMFPQETVLIRRRFFTPRPAKATLGALFPRLASPGRSGSLQPQRPGRAENSPVFPGEPARGAFFS